MIDEINQAPVARVEWLGTREGMPNQEQHDDGTQDKRESAFVHKCLPRKDDPRTARTPPLATRRSGNWRMDNPLSIKVLRFWVIFIGAFSGSSVKLSQETVAILV
jgi:hypothetical protein